MIDQFAPCYEHLIAKHMPKFAAIENTRANKVWGADIGGNARQRIQNGGRTPDPISEQTYNEAVRLYKSGGKFCHIMRDLELSKYALSRILAEEGLREFPMRDLPKKAREIREMLKMGMKHNQIAAELRISRQGVSDWVKRYGLNKW